MGEQDEKALLRKRMRALRRALPQQEQERASGKVCAQILALPQYKSARVVMAYMAGGGELSLKGVIENVLSCKKTLALPRCEVPGVMTARRVQKMGELRPGAYGLLEPDEGCPVIPPGEIDLIFVPGTAFDRRGARLGQGGGYYDRFLPGCAAQRFGVCHDFALTQRLEEEAHDARMNAVIFPSGMLIL